MPVFSCQNVSRYYNDIATILNVNLQLFNGELVCILGASGVGKTTLFNILSGVDKPDSGSVYLRGENITGVAGRVSYMLQKDLLLPFKTIMENVTLPLIIKGMSEEEAQLEAGPLFHQFGLSGYEHRYPKQLSGGMRQRGALLRTFLSGNDTILLDEPFSALDPITKGEMHRWYLEIKDRLSLTTLFITHDITEALYLSDRIYVMTGKPGNIVREFTNLPKVKKGFQFSLEAQSIGNEILSAMGI